MHTAQPVKSPSEAGFSLVELMVALALSLAVVGGSMMVFTSQRRGFDRQQEVVNEQQISRYVLSQIGEEVRQAGLWTRTSQPQPAPPISSVNNRPAGGLAIAGTDTLRLRYAQGMIPAINDITSGTTTITLQWTDYDEDGVLEFADFDSDGNGDVDGSDFENNKTLRLAVSEGPFGQMVEEVVAISLAGDTLTLRDPLVNAYDRPLVGLIRDVQYTLDDAVYPDGSIIPTIYRQELRFRADGTIFSPRQQLANFIDDFQVSFGHLDPYQDVLAAVGVANLTALRVSLVTRSEEQVMTAAAELPAIQDSGRAVAADHYHRRVYEQTIALRN